ncbi:MAG TPA: hypothetical protein VKA36_01470 [Solirubrobacterales bacterium]|nr:hypothetical protein [Solirubrobacterales bacterium]
MGHTIKRKPITTRIGDRLEEICADGGMEPPDLVLGLTDEEALALWFESQLAVVVTADGGESSVDDATVGRMALVCERITWICQEGGLQKPDGMSFGEGPDGRDWFTVHWNGEDFEPSWAIDDFLDGFDRSPAGDQSPPT